MTDEQRSVDDWRDILKGHMRDKEIYLGLAHVCRYPGLSKDSVYGRVEELVGDTLHYEVNVPPRLLNYLFNHPLDQHQPW